jgi:hypothetical protein
MLSGTVMLQQKIVSGTVMLQCEISARWQLDEKSMTQFGRDLAKPRT